MLEDKLLVLRCKGGSRDAMRAIYQKYKDYLLTVAKALLNEKTAAEDVVHDVFVSFAQSIDGFELKRSLKGYLSVCVCNLARDKLRARKRKTEKLASYTSAGSDIATPEQRLIETEQSMRTRGALSQLPYEQREVIVLHLKGGLKFRQIAGLQDVSVSTVHGRYRYGLDKLRTLLNSEVEK